MDARNPVYSNESSTSIDVELNHPTYGWIAFTATATDVEPLGREIHARAIAEEFGPVSPYVPPELITRIPEDAINWEV